MITRIPSLNIGGPYSQQCRSEETCWNIADNRKTFLRPQQSAVESFDKNQVRNQYLQWTLIY